MYVTLPMELVIISLPVTSCGTLVSTKLTFHYISKDVYDTNKFKFDLHKRFHHDPLSPPDIAVPTPLLENTVVHSTAVVWPETSFYNCPALVVKFRNRKKWFYFFFFFRNTPYTSACIVRARLSRPRTCIHVYVVNDLSRGLVVSTRHKYKPTNV